MENVAKVFTKWQLHPFVDHFTVALLIVGVLVDLVALIFSQRLWLRYMALTLMVLGAAAAGGSVVTGHLEADRVWKLISDPKAKDLLKAHALYGQYVMYIFAALAVWRILIQALAFMDRTRQVYLALAVLAVGFLLYQGRLGGELVYTYGVGTGAMAAAAQAGAAAAVPEASAAPSAPTAIPTVYVPTAAPTAAPTEAPSATPASASETPAAASPEKSAEPEPSAKPTV